MELTRRELLIGSAVGGGLLVGFALLPRHYPAPLMAQSGELGIDGWLVIDTDGTVTVAIPQLEMGQGVATVLAQIAAVELGADWSRISVQPVPVSEIYANAPLAAGWAELCQPTLAAMAPARAADPAGWLASDYASRNRFMVTADGTSLAAYEAPLRHAAATARAMLAKAAATRWGGDWAECEAKGGAIVLRQRRLPFGALASAAARQSAPEPPPTRPESARELPSAFPSGTPPGFPRLDSPSKADGSHIFAGDVRLPDMLFAAIRHAPIGEARVAGFDPARAHGVTGFARLVKGPDWLAALASDSWAAERALALIAPRFAVHAPADTARIEAALDKSLRSRTATRLFATGDAEGLLAEHRSLSQRYDVAPALHASVETASATARLRDGRCELWVASQAPEAARVAVAEALDMAVRDIILYPLPAGGSFDARLEHGHAVEAALIAKAAGRPIQLTYSRWQEAITSRPRPPVAAQISARVNAAGEITAWQLRAALPAAAREFGARVLDGIDPVAAMQAAGDHADPMALAGAVPPYAIANLAIDHMPTAISLPSGRLRGNAHGYTAFFTECFIDELAASLHREPLSFRMAMLEGDARLAACLQRVSALAGWNGVDGSGGGLACHRIGTIAGQKIDDGGCIAAIAMARRDERGVRVDRMHAVADIGRIVNVDIARQQIEGGLVFGIGLALGSSTAYDRGLPVTGRLSGLGLPLLGDCPEITVELIDSAAPAFDPGELGVAVAAPAVANALASATGLRFRKLPLTSEE